MSEHRIGPTDTSSSDELVSLLAKRGKRGRAKSTSVLIVVLLVLLGVLIGIGIGRATVPADDQPGPGASQQGEEPGGGPFGGRPRE
jgi:hypothetical protein